MGRLTILALVLVLLAPVPARANGFTHALKKVAHAAENVLLVTAVLAGVVVVCASGACR